MGERNAGWSGGGVYWERRVGSGQWEEGKERGRRGGESDTWESTVGYVFEGTEGQRHVGFKGCSGSMHAHTYQLPLLRDGTGKSQVNITIPVSDFRT